MPASTASAASTPASKAVEAAVADAATSPAAAGALRVYTSAQGATQQMRVSTVDAPRAGHALTEKENSIFVNPQRRFQEVLGIGGAITDASAETFARLPKPAQRALLTAYYDPQKGIGYTLVRTTIHSSDFSSGSYTYIKDGDAALKSFSVRHDQRYRIPMLRQAIAAAGGKLTTFASPWSAPAFMKDSNNMLKGGKLLPAYAQAWATYYTRFIAAYEKAGIPIWGISLQNEPMAVQTWESMVFSAEEERDFLKNHLGPTMEHAGYGDRKIIVWDHNRDMMLHRAHVIFDDPEAAKYAWGMGFHWYETWAGFAPMVENVAAVAQAYPDKPLLLTEAAVEKFDPAKLQYWPNGERYGTAIINDLNHGAVGWTDWNILLDQTGGPNHVGNYCFAPVHADTRTGEVIYTPSYWYIGHFSKFIRPGARRVSAASSRSNLATTSFLNTDGSLSTVVMNTSDVGIRYNLYVGDASSELEIPAHAIQTVVMTQ
ncbi:glycoside hydrolase family 30 protein [Xanthomonas floridensis]|uniref:Glycoside hydrolase family 30 protein n=1 Tax=Xanthomonas floridensis TaxID=1843580 RepID=A0A1A9M9G1_9XANT|nr:glycoside hydrolase family 30 protein [Xanthomonas floridensis]MEA5123204.1 glycoside hydrolase family 30 protein [Xanthomonas floridensis]MEA5130770.1 glycoside hydrolase family 30 protein [Xanthomonas floridensis]OAG66848.1 glycosyl hydrolase [Xanthomonas floridensis]